MKIFFSLIVLIISTLIFIYLDNGMSVTDVHQIIQPLLFAITLTACLFLSKLRRFFLIFSLCLLILMVIFYLLQMLEVSDWFGRLGFGVLFITILTYLPQFVQKGYIEKF